MDASAAKARESIATGRIAPGSPAQRPALADERAGDRQTGPRVGHDALDGQSFDDRDIEVRFALLIEEDSQVAARLLEQREHVQLHPLTDRKTQLVAALRIGVRVPAERVTMTRHLGRVDECVHHREAVVLTRDAPADEEGSVEHEHERLTGEMLDGKCLAYVCLLGPDVDQQARWELELEAPHRVRLRLGPELTLWIEGEIEARVATQFWTMQRHARVRNRRSARAHYPSAQERSIGRELRGHHGCRLHEKFLALGVSGVFLGLRWPRTSLQLACFRRRDCGLRLSRMAAPRPQQDEHEEGHDRRHAPLRHQHSSRSHCDPAAVQRTRERHQRATPALAPAVLAIEPAPQLRESTRNPLARRLTAATLPPRDLGRLELLEVPKDHRRAVRLVEREHRAAEFLQRLRAQHGFLGPLDRLRARRALLDLRALPLPLPKTTRQMPHRAAQPARDARRRPRPPQGRDPRLLREILPEPRIPDQRARQRPQSLGLPPQLRIGRHDFVHSEWMVTRADRA
ncbi:MAG: hypothetical protein ABL998_10440 [Planctomycetota bacterium]